MHCATRHLFKICVLSLDDLQAEEESHYSSISCRAARGYSQRDGGVLCVCTDTNITTALARQIDMNHFIINDIFVNRKIC